MSGQRGKKKLTKQEKAKMIAKQKAEAQRDAIEKGLSKEEMQAEAQRAAAAAEAAAREVGRSVAQEDKQKEFDEESKVADRMNMLHVSQQKRRKDDYRTATGVLHSQKFAKDIKIGGFSLQAHGSELIQDTMIELTIGRRYGLIGSNGSGKSEFLKCLASGELPIPDHIDIFHLDTEAEPSDRTAVQAVVDVVRNEYNRLENEAMRLMEESGVENPMLELINSKLDDMDPETFDTRAGLLLHGLGFSKEMMNKRTRDMSGGWRMRVSLAQALFVKPTLLLLDEPTNHLDLEGCVWLEDYLSRYPYCLVVVSHSEDFLNTVCTNIIHMTKDREFVNYTGNYSQFVTTHQEHEVSQMKAWKQEQDDIKHIKAFIASCGTFSNLVKQAKSKQKILDKMYAKGLTPRPTPDPVFNFRFADCERLPPPILVFQDVAFSYSGKKEDFLYEHLNLGLDSDSRVALVGPNGAGKSTLIKLMTGELQASTGFVRRHMHLSFGKYHQHSNEALDLHKSPLDYLDSKYSHLKWSEERWRQQLGRFGLSGKVQKSKIQTMSDGLKSRLVFAEMATANPNLLLLDEPTNHLDMQSIDALAQAINHFQGGVVLVSHDFRLLRQVAKQIWICDKRRVSVYDGTISDYKAGIAKSMGLHEQRR